MPSQVVRRWEDFGTANTPTATNGIRVDAVVEGIVRDDGGTELHVSVTTTNYAMFDNAVGAVKVGLLDDGGAIAQYEVHSDRNPGRGFQPPTVRQGYREVALPKDRKFNQVALSFWNLDNPSGATVDWGKVIAIGTTLITNTLAGA